MKKLKVKIGPPCYLIGLAEMVAGELRCYCLGKPLALTCSLCARIIERREREYAIFKKRIIPSKKGFQAAATF